MPVFKKKNHSSIFEHYSEMNFWFNAQKPNEIQMRSIFCWICFQILKPFKNKQTILLSLLKTVLITRKRRRRKTKMKLYTYLYLDQLIHSEIRRFIDTIHNSGNKLHEQYHRFSFTFFKDTFKPGEMQFFW